MPAKRNQEDPRQTMVSSLLDEKMAEESFR